MPTPPSTAATSRCSSTASEPTARRSPTYRSTRSGSTRRRPSCAPPAPTKASAPRPSRLRDGGLAADCAARSVPAPERQHRDGADAGGTARVFGEAGVAARLLAEDPVSPLTLELGDIGLVLVVTGLDATVPSSHEVAIPLGVRRCSCLGGEHVD